MARVIIFSQRPGAIPVALAGVRWAPGYPIQIYLVFGQLVSTDFGIAMHFLNSRATKVIDCQA